MNLFKEMNKRDFLYTHIRQIVINAGYNGWKSFRSEVTYNNHKLVAIEYLDETIDTGTITVDGFEELHDYHTFALSCGVFTKNSLGEIGDLKYFQNRFLQGLRIPSSYMSASDAGGSMVQDGKVGVAYIEELRFANYVARLQSKLNPTFDLFQIKLNDPQNFKIYKQAEVDEKLISNFNSIKDVKSISKRYALMHYLGWSEDELQTNEAMLKQELAIPEGGIADRLNELRMMYDDKWVEGRPEIKVDDSYEDFTAQTKKVEPKETPPEEEPEPSGSEEMEQPEGGESEAPEKVEEPVTSEEGGEEPKEEPTPDLKDIESDIKEKE
jgi:hypothetical protein